MKNLLLTFLAIAFIGCSATNTVTMSVKEPAPVGLPPGMDSIGIINRHQPDDKKQVLDKIDEVLSAEGANLDKDGALESITGLMEELNKANRFDEIKDLEGGKLANPKFGVLPAPISWDKIAAICSENQLDGVFSLEFYDTDSDIDYDIKNVELEGPMGLKVPAIEHHATVTTTIKTGWRIYDNNSRNIIDEYVVTEHMTTSGKGVNPTKAVAAITGRKEAVNQISNEIGRSYGQNIVPYWTRVKRDYYVKGNDSFEIAKRRAQTGNWESAADIWREETKNPNSKIAARAYYNMAIINEINGEIDVAIEWAQQAYEDYGDKLALRYLNILKNRKARLEVLARQE